MSQSNKVKAGQGILPDDQSWLVRSAGSDNSITPVNSTSTVSPPPHIGHGCMWVEWSSSLSRTHYLLFVSHHTYLQHSVWVIEVQTERTEVFPGSSARHRLFSPTGFQFNQTPAVANDYPPQSVHNSLQNETRCIYALLWSHNVQKKNQNHLTAFDSARILFFLRTVKEKARDDVPSMHFVDIRHLFSANRSNWYIWNDAVWNLCNSLYTPHVKLDRIKEVVAWSCNLWHNRLKQLTVSTFSK